MLRNNCNKNNVSQPTFPAVLRARVSAAGFGLLDSQQIGNGGLIQQAAIQNQLYLVSVEGFVFQQGLRYVLESVLICFY